jgi:hypothetical protein
MREDQMRVMKSLRSKKPARSKKTAGSTKTKWFADRAGVIVSILIVAFVAVTMMMAREPVTSADDAERQPIASADSSALIRTGAPEEDVPVRTTGERTDAAAAPDKKAAPVTIVGCVQRDDDGFRLTKTSGADAPKARSWKSGFMRKGSASLDLVDGSGGLRLASHVGQRVSVTGMLDDRELRARSLRRVGDSCN